MTKTYTLPAVTVADQVGDRKYHTLGAVAGIKFIKILTDNELRWCINPKTKTFEKVRRTIGADTNPNWLVARAGEELCERGKMNWEELHRLTS
jgi:hypothetical protein